MAKLSGHSEAVDSLLGRGDFQRGGAPEPTLLPILAETAPKRVWAYLCERAEGFGRGRFVPHGVAWPALADATIFELAKRADPFADFRDLVSWSPRAVHFLPREARPEIARKILNEMTSGNASDSNSEALCRMVADTPELMGGEALDIAIRGARLSGEPWELAYLIAATRDDAQQQAQQLEWLMESGRIDPGSIPAALNALHGNEHEALLAHVIGLAREQGPDRELAQLAYIAPLLPPESRPTVNAAVSEAGARFIDDDTWLPEWFKVLIIQWLVSDEELVPVAQDLASTLDPQWEETAQWREHAERLIATGAGRALNIREANLRYPESIDVTVEPGLVPAALDKIMEEWGGAPPQSQPQPASLVMRAIRGLRTLLPGSQEEPVASAPPEPDEEVKRDPGPRQLQADVCWENPSTHRFEDALHGFVAGAKHRVDVSIGWSGRIRATGQAFIEPRAEKDQQVFELVVHFIHGENTAQEELELPVDRGKESEVVSFTMRVDDGLREDNAFVVVTHRGRILQAAELIGTVYETREDEQAAVEEDFRLETRAWPHQLADLTDRSSFDASIVDVGESGAAALRGKKLGLADVQGLEKIREKISRELFDLSERASHGHPDMRGDDVSKLLRFLANQGAVLHTALIAQLMPELDDAERIQIVTTNASRYLPLEFVYSGKTPASDARLCEKWQHAVERGECQGCDREVTDMGRTTAMCPLDFWGLSKTIERHAALRGREDAFSFEVFARATNERTPLKPFSRVLFGASELVPADAIDETVEELRKLSSDVDEAASWAEWRNKIAGTPSMLVTMPHNAEEASGEVEALHLSRGEALLISEVLKGGFVRPEAGGPESPGPLVVLLGCKTAEAKSHPILNFVGAFRIGGAAAVVGTYSDVLAEESPKILKKVTETLRGSIAAEQGDASANLGDVMLTVRRQMFADGFVIALGVAAFGDADWAMVI